MERKILRAQPVSKMCFVCGLENAWGLKARFFDLGSGEVLALVTPDERHQGYPGRLHGGIASALLDEVIGRAINVGGAQTWHVTVELSVRFRKPVPLGEPVRALGRVTRDTRRVFEGTGEILLDDGSVAIEARAKYMKLPIDRIVEGDLHDQWFEDPRPIPPTLTFRQ